ncbi:amylosucrase [Reinekea blandensis]|uniref:Alpha amylase, catalytic region n=1 Tax=Reinekea blandensis MED297 TaxID=314283 RepID=A4BK34_9GAMM|nr:amylosucrase [Reinekea blandensis]EAR07516.1 Alpha amylase, catalytic region [Reinekea sp. MED297] [Reinekea blandensis MED297]
MPSLNQTDQAAVALQRVWPKVRSRFTRHANRDRLAAFKHALDQDFPRLFARLISLYEGHWDFYYHLEQLLVTAANQWLGAEAASSVYQATDHAWIHAEDTIGATGYVDLFGGDLKGLTTKIDYLKDLGISYLHLMPFFDVPEGDSDGGYAIRNYGAVNPKIGTLDDLKHLSQSLAENKIKLVLDFVFNHTSDQHEWAEKAKAGDKAYQDFYWLMRDPAEKDAWGAHLRDIFPDKRQGCFTWNDEVNAWVWTTFNSFQWDLNYTNPAVFHAMCSEMLKLVNAGADVIRLDALAFTWKQQGTVCENLPKAHELIQAFNAFLRISAPQVALKSEAIVAPDDVMGYISPEECQLSYNPNLMALMWEALATRQTRLLINGSRHRTDIPDGSAWVNYLRCHDDIGWAFADADAWHCGINPHDHRYFLNQFYTGQFPGSFARGVPFQADPRTGDCRISGMFASLVGLEKAAELNDDHERTLALKRIRMMHGVLFAFKGIPLIYLGDELGLMNDHSYLDNPAHINDSRWVHRMTVPESALARRQQKGTTEHQVFSDLQSMLRVRKTQPALGVGDIQIEPEYDEHLFMFRRRDERSDVLIIANFSEHRRHLSAHQCQALRITDCATDLLTGNSFPCSDGLTLEAYDLLWLDLTTQQ